MGPELDEIATPLLVTEPAASSHYAGQLQRLFDRLRGPKALIAEPPSPVLREAQIFDWFDYWLAPA